MSAADGSLIIDTRLDNSQAHKDLQKLERDIEKAGQHISTLKQKRDDAKTSTVVKAAELDAEKAVRDRLKTTLREMRSIAKDASYTPSIRAETQAQIPAVETDFKDQQERISMLQSEFNKILNSVDRYDQKIADATEKLNVQKAATGALVKEINDKERFLYGITASAEVADQRIVDLTKELSELKERQKELDSLGIGLGYQEYDDITKRIALITGELKEYQKQLQDTANVDGGGPVQSQRIEELSAGAQDAIQRISELNEQLSDLEAKQASLGLALGRKAKAEYNELSSQISDANSELAECRAYLDDLARSGDLASIADGSEIAEQRIEELTQELADLEQQQANLGLAIGAKAEYEALSEEIERVNRLLEDYRKNVAAVDETATPDGGDADGRAIAQERINAYLEKSCSLYQKLSGYIGQLREVSTVMQDMASVTDGRLAGALQTASAAAGGFGDALNGALAAAGPYTAIAAVVINVLQRAAGAIKNLAQTAVDGFRTTAKAVGDFITSVAKNFVALLKSIGRWVGEFSKNFNVFSGLAAGLTQKYKGLGQMIRRVFVFSVITSGLRAIRTQMSAYLQVNTEFTNALRRLQGVLLTAFQPIYDIVVPALTTLINVLTRAAATVTQFFASLFGTAAKQAQANAKNLYEQANATTAAGEAAEEASKQFANFDDINKLEGNKSAGGGGATSVDTGPLFDYEYDETPFDSWGEAFNGFLDKLLSGIPKLRDKFKDFADWLNDLSKKLYDMFTFPGVLDKVKQLGRDLANALNDLVNWVDWYQLGQALGAGLNLALNFLTSFLYEFDWINLGRKLAEFVNGLVSEIDWYEFGRLLWAGFKIGLETLAGFIIGLDMPQLAEAASNIVLGFFNEMQNTIRRIEWGEIGRQIAEFLANLKWYEMLSSVTSAIAGGLMAAVAAVRGFLTRIVPELDRIAKEIVTALIEFFRDKVDWKEMARTIGDGIAAALRFVAGLLDPELFYEIGKAIGDFLINLQWVEIFSGLAKALANGINSAIAALKGFLDAVEPHLKEIADGIADSINKFVDEVNWDELGETLNRGIQAALDFLVELMGKIDWGAVANAVHTALSKIDWASIAEKVAALLVDWFGIKARIAFLKLEAFADIGLGIVNGIKMGILKAITGILLWLKEHLIDPIVDGVRNLLGIHSPSTVFAEIGENLIAGLLKGISDTWNSIVEFFSTAVESLKQFFSDAWESIKTTASTAWESIKTVLSQAWDGLKEAASTTFTAIKDKISEVWDNIQQKSSEIWENIKSALSETWNALKTTAQEKFDAIRQKISEVWENIKQATSSAWENIKSKLSAVWDNLKSTASAKFEEIRSKISNAWENVKTNTFNAWENIKSTVSNALSSIWSNVTSKFSEIVSAARTWGSDICKNISDGINGAIGKVTSAARGVANSIKDFLGFSEPKKGPLSNFHTYMPDMLELMSDGIRKNTHLAVGAASDLADAVANSLNRGTYSIGNVNMGKVPDMSNYTIPLLAQGSAIPTSREFTEVVTRKYNGSDSQISDIEGAVARAMRAASISGGGNITVVMEIDGREFGRASYKYGTQEQQRVGVRLTEART